MKLLLDRDDLKSEFENLDFGPDCKFVKFSNFKPKVQDAICNVGVGIFYNLGFDLEGYKAEIHPPKDTLTAENYAEADLFTANTYIQAQEFRQGIGVRQICDEGGECVFTADLEYDTSGETFNCEKCGLLPGQGELIK